MAKEQAERIRTEIHRLFRQETRDRQAFIANVNDLHLSLGDRLYVGLLFSSAHLEFTPRTAKKHFHNILEHWEEMNQALHREIDFRVALLDYFVSINRRIKNPTIIELRILRKTQQETEVDELTELFNFRYLRRHLDLEVTRAIRYNTPLSLVLLDVDDFKYYNDHNGHLAGNKALKKLARILQQSVRNVDIAARFGGEEFALLLPETGKEGAQVIAERIRQAVAKAKFTYGSKQPLKRFTVSGGIASLHMDALTTDTLITKADQALYQAKARGKNQVALFITEKRMSERVPAAITATIRSSPYTGEVVLLGDISESGFSFHFNQAIAENNAIIFGLELPGRKTRIKCTATVQRLRALQGSSKYDIGVRIDEIGAAGKKLVHQYIANLLDALHA